MDAYSSPNPGQASWIARLARRVRGTVSEMNYASARVIALRLCEGLEASDRAPDTYAEFLLRMPTTSLHEPPARCR
jgi:predicted phosphoadenosine phosphosulfate sulfurtransferase